MKIYLKKKRKRSIFHDVFDEFAHFNFSDATQFFPLMRVYLHDGLFFFLIYLQKSILKTDLMIDLIKIKN